MIGPGAACRAPTEPIDNIDPNQRVSQLNDSSKADGVKLTEIGGYFHPICDSSDRDRRLFSPNM